MTHSKEINDCIESICKQGCTVVREVITALENKQQVDGVDQLKAQDRDTVLFELKHIMSVYDNK